MVFAVRPWTVISDAPSRTIMPRRPISPTGASTSSAAAAKATANQAVGGSSNQDMRANAPTPATLPARLMA
jgi:hypothetical protein